jgi:GntR family transcriptional regulator
MQNITKDPVYLQICNILKNLIEEGEYKQGDRFLSEREVSIQFDVSRTTANKSLSSLVGEGILTYKKGVGTFVSDSIADISVDVQSFLKDSENLSFDIKVFCERPFDEIPESIQKEFDREKSIYYIMAVYLMGGIPVLINRKYINTSKTIESGEEFLSSSYFDYNIAEKEISLTKLTKKDAPLLKLEEGEPLYLIKDELRKDESTIYDVSILRTDCIIFSMDTNGKLIIRYGE